jgi:hypothetical protein
MQEVSSLSLQHGETHDKNVGSVDRVARIKMRLLLKESA